MEIAIVTDGIYPYDEGGHQIRIHRLVKEFTKNHHVDVYVQSKPKVNYPKEHLGAKIQVIDSKISNPSLRLTIGGAFYMRSLVDRLKRNYDIVDVSFYAATFTIDAPTVVTYGAFLQRWSELNSIREKFLNIPPIFVQYLLYWVTLSSRDSVICLSDKSRSEINHIYRQSDDIFTVKNGVDGEMFTKEGPEAEIPNLGEFVGFYGGRLHREKGVFELIEAISRTNLDIGLVVAGDGPAREEMKKEVRKYGIRDSVIFLGIVEHDRMPNYYRSCDITFLPSYFEIQPLSCIESMACGTPVVATKIAGVKEMISNEETGLLVKPKSAIELSEATERCLQNEDLRQELILKGQEFAKNRTWKRIAEDTIDVYKETMKQQAD